MSFVLERVGGGRDYWNLTPFSSRGPGRENPGLFFVGSEAAIVTCVYGAGVTYPTDLLHGCRTGLLLFGAGFLGENDGRWFRRQGIHSIVVDRDAEKLAEMRREYPGDWAFLAGDAFEYAERYARAGLRFDAVSVDPPLHMLDDCFDLLPLWLSLSNHLLTLTSRDGVTWQGEGWRMSTITRVAGSTQWLVCEKLAYGKKD